MKRNIPVLAICVFLSLILSTRAQSQEYSYGMTLPTVPDTLRTVPERLEYVMMHYWDAMPWDNEEAIGDTMFVEVVHVDFFHLMSHADSALTAKAYNKLMNVEPESVLPQTGRLAMKYLYSPDSPIYNVRAYEAVAQSMLQNEKTDEALRIIMRTDLADLAINRPGTKAVDFKFIARDGTEHSLYEYDGKYNKIILFFYDPDCDTCTAAEKKMSVDPLLNSELAAGRTMVLAITPYEVEPVDWQQHAGTLPASWLVGYSPDGAIDADGTYRLPTSPSVYMLDGGLNVAAEP